MTLGKANECFILQRIVKENKINQQLKAGILDIDDLQFATIRSCYDNRETSLSGSLGPGKTIMSPCKLT